MKGFADSNGEVVAGDAPVEAEPPPVDDAAGPDDDENAGIEAARGPVGMPLAPDAKGVTEEVVAEAEEAPPERWRLLWWTPLTWPAAPLARGGAPRMGPQPPIIPPLRPPRYPPPRAPSLYPLGPEGGLIGMPGLVTISMRFGFEGPVGGCCEEPGVVCGWWYRGP